ncbi:MAG TPA: hypothetical protein VG032_06270 [Acidimicrobiales bacterium]|jgi:hypothetical protein|nr:hypothetical protein [Acidimicrobiales bacterium]
MDLHVRRLTNEWRIGKIRGAVAKDTKADPDAIRAQLAADAGSAGLTMLFEAIDDVTDRLRVLEAKVAISGDSGNVSRLEFENLAHQVMKLKKRVKRSRG